MIVTDFEGHILAVSPAIPELCGYREEELVGATPAKFKSGQTPDKVYRELWETIRSGKTWSGAFLNKRKDGSHFFDRETIMNCTTPRGHAGFIAIHRDADSELKMRLRIADVERRLDERVSEVEDAKSTIKTLATMTLTQTVSAQHALISALEARDYHTVGHGQRTATLMALLGEELGLFERVRRDTVEMGAILHDLGKIGIPDAILHKPGRLTDAEIAVMQMHPVIGFDILSLASKAEEILRIVRHHHERLDGSGYPDGLRGDQIPDYVRAFTVCDCFDAMTSTRAYRGALTGDEAISILTDDALLGKLDMSAVKAMRRLWKRGILNDLVLRARAAS